MTLAHASLIVFADEGRRGMALNSLVTSGGIVSGATVRRSVLFSNIRVGENSVIEDAVIRPNVVVGRGVILRRVVVDKHRNLPDGFKAGVNPAEDCAHFHVTERGVTLITPKMQGQAYPAEWHGVRSA